MEITLITSTGAKLTVWRVEDLFHAQRHGRLLAEQTCLGVDLFEVIADLAELDLDDHVQAGESTRLAERTIRRLRPEDTAQEASVS